MGYSVIPLAPRDKRPYVAILDEHAWSPYQKRRPSEDEIHGWLARGHDHNWGVVCGSVSGGLYCGDVDDPWFARWAIEHARDPVFRGACVVETGSHKAHIWFLSSDPVRSGKWRPRGGKAVGDIRGEGNGDAGPSYMVVPPSVHPDGDQYTFRAGSMRSLPTVANGDEFLADILAAYLRENPQGTPPQPSSSNKDVLSLDPDDQARVWNQVRDLSLSVRYRDTILEPGHQDPASRHWQRSPVSSHSDIDFSVCCELIRKGLSFEQIERVFAACKIGAACYRNTSRPNHGYSYLKLTYDNALADVERKKQDARLATGTNFQVLDAGRIEYDKGQSRYRLRLECTRHDSTKFIADIEIDDIDLTTLERFEKACFRLIQFTPEFSNNQQGRHFLRTFGQAVANSVTDVRIAPAVETRLGSLAQVLRRFLRMLRDGQPADSRHTMPM